MSATPIVPGRLYRVRGNGFDVTVIASDGFAAIIAMLPRAMPCEE